MKDQIDIKHPYEVTNIENLVSSPMNKEQGDPRHKFHDAAVDFYKKLCLKLYISPNTLFVNILKQDILQVTLDMFSLKELNLVNKTISKFNYFKQIVMSTSDHNSNYKVN